MRHAARWSALGAVVLLVVLGQLLDRERPEELPTSYGTGPAGFRALFDLLAELGMAPARTHEAAAGLPPAETVWWLRARELAGTVVEGAEVAPPPPGRAGVKEWVEAGGTAVVMLAPGSLSVRVLDGADLPRRECATCGVGTRSVRGRITPRARRVKGVVSAFVDAGDWRVEARIGKRPFVLARALGSGRLVVLADSGFLANADLDRGDAALLAVDLARAYGAPLFAEAVLTLPPPGALAYLARSPAAPVFVALAVLGLLLAWRGSLVPARTLAEDDGRGPDLDAFVRSLATLYAGTRDHARVLARYRELTVARLRRHFGLPRDTPVERVCERLARERRLPAERLRHLTDEATVTAAPELHAACGALDALVREAAR